MCLVNLLSFVLLTQKYKLSYLLFVLIHIIKKEILLNLLKGSRRIGSCCRFIYLFYLDHFLKIVLNQNIEFSHESMLTNKVGTH